MNKWDELRETIQEIHENNTDKPDIETVTRFLLNLMAVKDQETEYPNTKDIMSFLDGLAQDDWRMFHSDSEVQEIARRALELLKEQDEQIRILEYNLAVTQDNLRYYTSGNS